MRKALFDVDPDEVPMTFERWGILFDAHAFARLGGGVLKDIKPRWELDETSICETREAVVQCYEENYDWRDSRIVKLNIETVEHASNILP